MYLTLDEYKAMGGTLESPIFDELEFDARAIVDYYTFGRIQKLETLSENIKRVMYKLIELGRLEKAINPLTSTEAGVGAINSAILRQSNDGYSTAYNVLGASDVGSSVEYQAKALVEHYLANEKDALGRRLLFRGLYPGE